MKVAVQIKQNKIGVVQVHKEPVVIHRGGREKLRFEDQIETFSCSF